MPISGGCQITVPLLKKSVFGSLSGSWLRATHDIATAAVEIAKAKASDFKRDGMASVLKTPDLLFATARGKAPPLTE